MSLADARHAKRSPGGSQSNNGTSGLHRNSLHTSAFGLNQQIRKVGAQLT